VGLYVVFILLLCPSFPRMRSMKNASPIVMARQRSGLPGPGPP
jgi:hypothetical protein